MNISTSGTSQHPHEGEKRCLNSELWHACAGPLVSLPTVGSRVVYFSQGHSEQVAATTNKEVDVHIPSYPGLPPQLICHLHNVTMHADIDTDEVYAQLTLQPLTPEELKDTYLPMELGIPSKQPTNYFCKTLTASDTSTHGGFSVPRRAAEKVFPPLDFSQTPPAQELFARDLHDVEWKFKHIFRGQPKRHLLTTGWSVFVSAKRLVAGDSILFIWNEKNQLLLGIRRAARPQTIMPSSVLSSDSMHIGLLAAAAHAAATNSCFNVFYNPRASPSEFVIPLSKYVKAVYHTRVSVGMRFRMLFETEESSVRRYMGTVTGIGDLDPSRWPNSHWRSVKVGWDESTASERQARVSLWEIEPLTTFPMYPSLFPLRLKRPWYPGTSSFQGEIAERMNFQSASTFPWMQSRADPLVLRNDLSQQQQQYQAMMAGGLQNFGQFQQVMQFQQPVQYHNLLSEQQQIVEQSIINQTLLQRAPQQQDEQHTYQQQAFPIQNDQLQQISFTKSDLANSNSKFSSSVTPSNMQNMLGSLCGAEGSGGASGNLLNVSRCSQAMLNEPSWVMKFVGDSCNSPSIPTVHEQETVLHGNVNSSQSPHVDTPSSMPMPVGAQDSQYGYVHLLQQPTTSTRTFVKVYKSGCVGRSVDMSQFSSYHELRRELGEMFGIQGLLEDPQRSGWQLVFVDEENDVLLLGDDPWESFVNNVWYIKILSPEDVLNLGRREAESSSRGASAQDHLPSLQY